MSGVNKVILVGHLGKDPETKAMPSGGAVTNITLATSESWKDNASGEKKEKTEWHRVVFFNKLAEVAAQYLKKGAQVYVEGKITTRKWQNKEGVDQYTTEIVANEMQMLGGKPGSGAGGGDYSQSSSASSSTSRSSGQSAPQSQPAGMDVPFDDDIPF